MSKTRISYRVSRVIVVHLVLGCLVFACDYSAPSFWCDRTAISETKALEIGKRKVQHFCEISGFTCDDTSKPLISKTKDVPWIMDYTSDNREDMKYFVRVTIDSCGVIETSGEVR